MMRLAVLASLETIGNVSIEFFVVVFERSSELCSSFTVARVPVQRIADRSSFFSDRAW